MKKINLDLSSFHDYDIRGVYPTEINEEFYYHLGKSVAKYFKKGVIGVGHDVRLSSLSLTKNLIKGITDYGVDVVSLGLISTEMHNFATVKYGFIANIIVTASHNPPQYNGAKIAKANVVPLHGQYGLPEIKSYMNKVFPLSKRKGIISKKDIFNDWIDHALSFIDLSKINKKIKIVVDAGNGMGGPAWTEMSKKLPIKIIPLYLNPDGNFPHHIPDPLKDVNVKDLISKVKETHADFGIALDGDADRIFFVDEQGVKLTGSITTAIITEYLATMKSGTYLYNAICSRIVPETIKKLGSRAIRTRVGHSFIKEIMKKVNGVFAGEHSGHFFYRNNYTAESSLITGLLMLQIISESKKPLSTFRKKFDVYFSSGEINFKIKDRQKVVTAIKERFKKTADSIDELDGTSVWFKDWWFNARLSKTEPLLRINIEANTKPVLDQKKKDVLKILNDLNAVMV